MGSVETKDSKSTATNLAVNGRDEHGRFTIGNTPSSGFHTNPERRSDGRWGKEASISYWYNKLGNMPNEEYEKFIPKNAFQKIAVLRLERAMRDDNYSLAETKEITDRTEGKPRQDIGIEADEKATPIIRGFVIPTFPDGYVDEQITIARARNSRSLTVDAH